MGISVAATRSSIEEIRAAAHRIRVDSLRMTFTAGSGHPGGSLSEAEILATLYVGGILRYDPRNPKWLERDRFVLSKGHCCPGLYSMLAQRGYFPPEELAGFRKAGRMLQGHADVKVPGVEMSAGSLGMGLGFANGLAFAARADQRPSRTYVLLGDGECQEGNVWESAMTSAHHRLDNVCAIVDVNQIQIEGFTHEIKGLDPLAPRFDAFGWNAIEVDGHDPKQLLEAFERAAATKGRPSIILAHTVKGKGVSFMEGKAEYHGRALTPDEMARAMKELGEVWP